MSNVNGIDFGTTQSKLATPNVAGKPEKIPNERGDMQTPTVVYVSQSGEPLIGQDAIEQGVIDPTRLIRNFKLDLDSTLPLIPGESFTAMDAAVVVLKQLRQDAIKALGVTVEDCVTTSPANFNDAKKQALINALIQAGWKNHLIVPEPTAAAYAYALDKQRDKMTLAVFDFGGGTFDVTILKVDRGQFEVLATEGIARLGGNDLNQPLADQLLESVERKFGSSPEITSDPMLMLEIANKAETAKISLGKRDEVQCVVGYKGDQIIETFKAQEYQAAIVPMIQQCLDAMDQAVSSAGLSYDKIDTLLMVGGTSRMPFIQSMVADHTHLAPRMDIDPGHAIAYGAAHACAAELARQGKNATVNGHTIPAPAMFIEDVTAHGVGCSVIDSGSGEKQLVNAVIIPQNTPIPCKRKDEFALEHPGQKEAEIVILQGKANARHEDCLEIGKLRLTNLPPEENPSNRIEVEYTIDRNGMVTATATDKISGQSESVSMTDQVEVSSNQHATSA